MVQLEYNPHGQRRSPCRERGARRPRRQVQLLSGIRAGRRTVQGRRPRVGEPSGRNRPVRATLHARARRSGRAVRHARRVGQREPRLRRRRSDRHLGGIYKARRHRGHARLDGRRRPRGPKPGHGAARRVRPLLQLYGRRRRQLACPRVRKQVVAGGRRRRRHSRPAHRRAGQPDAAADGIARVAVLARPGDRHARHGCADRAERDVRVGRRNVRCGPACRGARRLQRECVRRHGGRDALPAARYRRSRQPRRVREGQRHGDARLRVPSGAGRGVGRPGLCGDGFAPAQRRDDRGQGAERCKPDPARARRARIAGLLEGHCNRHRGAARRVGLVARRERHVRRRLDRQHYGVLQRGRACDGNSRTGTLDRTG